MKRIKSRRATVGLSATAFVAIAVAAGVTLSGFSAAADGNGGRNAAAPAMAGMNGMAGMDMGASAAPGAAAASGDSAMANGGWSGSGDATYYVAGLAGANEVQKPGGPKVGDPNGRAVEFLRIQGDRIAYAIKWAGIGAPTAGHIHLGAKGVNGDVKVPFFMQQLPDSVNEVAGSVTVKDAKLLSELRTDPAGFYANVHTAAFPGGAVRGQLHKVNAFDFGKALSNPEASVVKGKVIYTCAKQPAGGWSFTQTNIDATLGGGIRYTFTHTGGQPVWTAPDGSAVIGKPLVKTPNGTGNIPEAELRATQAGKSAGLFSETREILRLNTVGGAAPTGTCDPHKQPELAVPYRADYIFING